MRRFAFFLLVALAAAEDESFEAVLSRQVAEAHAKGDRGRLVLLAAEPPLRVSYARVVDWLLRQGHVEAAEALAGVRQGPEAEGLARMVRAYRSRLFPTDDDREQFRTAANLLGKEPEAAIRLLADLKPAEGTLFAAEVALVRAGALDSLGRREEAKVEIERCAALARAVGEWAMARDAAEQRLRWSDLAGAPAAAEDFLEAARLLDDRKATVRALCARARVRVAAGRALMEAGKPDDARLRWRDACDDYLSAMDIAEKDGDRRQQGLCRRDLAVIWQSCLGQPVEALKFYSLAIPLLDDAGTPEERDGTILNAALVLTQLGRYDEALRRLEEVLAPGRFEPARPKALEQKAYVLFRTGRLRSALPAYEEALAAAAPLDRARLLAATGELHLARKDPDAALRAFDDALALAPGLAAAWADRAYALGQRGEEDEARRAFAKARELERDPVAKGRMLLMAAQLRSFGGAREAANLAKEALTIFTDVKLAQYANAGAAWKTVAEFTMLEGDHARAADQIAKASTLFFRLNLPGPAIDLYAQETLLMLMLDRPREATERLQILVRMAETTPDDALKSAARSAEAMFQAKGGRGQRALELLAEAERLAHVAGDRIREATALVNRALVDPEAAAEHARRAFEILDGERLVGPEERPLVEGYSPDWGPGIALDGLLKSKKEDPEAAFAFLERALARRLLLAFGGRDLVLVAGLPGREHDAYVAARADLVEARATRKGVAEAEAAFDVMVAGLRKARPGIADLAWPPHPPLVDVQGALRADEALVMALLDPYVKCALVVTKERAVLRRLEAPGYKDVADLLQGKRTVILAGPAFDAPPGARLCLVPSAASFLLQRAAGPPRGKGAAAIGKGPARLGAPLLQPPEERLALLYVDGIDLAPAALLRRRLDADTVVVVGPGGPLALVAAALLAGGAGNVVVGERPSGPLDTFLDACLDRRLSAAAAFLDASRKGPLFFHGPPE